MPHTAVKLDSLHQQAVALARRGLDLPEAVAELLRLAGNQRALVETARRMLIDDVRAGDPDALGGYVIAALAARRLP